MTDIDPLLARRHPLPPPSGTPLQASPAAVTAASVRRRRRHPAKGSRIAATGLGITTMFGLVAAMGMAAVTTSSAAAPAEPAPTTPSVQPSGGTTAPAATPTPPSTAPAASSAPVAPPVALTARPEVRVVAPAQQPVQAAPAPAATTSGSH